ncbi:MAG: efflux RND transporter periplasmic adaptor subunit [Gemmataceae bacterium]
MIETETKVNNMPVARPPANEPAVNSDMLNRVQQLRLDNQTAAVSKTARGGGASWLPWVLTLFLAITWAGIGIKEYKNSGNGKSPLTRNNGTSDGKSAGGPAISSGPIESGKPSAPAAAPGTVVIAQKGVLTPYQQITVSPIDVGGRVTVLNVIEGKLFKQGEILAKLDDVNYKAQMDEAEASVAGTNMRLEMARQRYAELDPKSVRKIEVDQAQEQLDEAKSQQTRAREDFERLSSVAKSGSAALSPREYQQAEADLAAANARVIQMNAALEILVKGPRKEKLKAAEAEIEAAEADLKAAKARLIQSKWRLDNCVIRAPIEGTVLRKTAEIGNLVNPMAFSASTSGGGGVCDLANLADMEVDMDIPERDIEKVFPGQKALVVPDAFKSREYKGVVDRIMPIADDTKSVIKIRVKVKLPENEIPGTYLKPKMSVVTSLLAPDPADQQPKK